MAAAPDHTVVVLGAGFVGVPMAHHLLKHTPAGVVHLRVILVAPNDAFFWNTAAPRGFLPVQDTSSSANPKGTPGYGDDRLFFELAPSFAKYNEGGATRFEQLVGRATSLDPDRQTVDVTPLAGGGQVESVHYDTLLIATGSDANHGMPFKIVSGGGTAETKAALATYRDQVREAAHIVVAGGGMTGVEVAGELASVYGAQVVGGSAPAAPASEKKEIVLVMNEPRPLGAYGAMDSVRKIAADRLVRLGVRIVADTTVTAAAVPPDSDDAAADAKKKKKKTVLTLAGPGGASSTLATDLYIPALGITFNAQFVPERLLDTSAAGRRRVRARPTLQVEGYDNIFVAGDVANAAAPSLKNVNDQLEVLATAMQTYLRNWAVARGAQTTGAAPAPAPAALKEYHGSDTVILAVSTGPAGGIGQFGNWKLWSFLVWLFKARYLGTDKARDYAEGRRTMMNTKW